MSGIVRFLALRTRKASHSTAVLSGDKFTMQLELHNYNSNIALLSKEVCYTLSVGFQWRGNWVDSHYEVKTSILESSLVQVLDVSLPELHVWFRVAIQVCVVAYVVPSNVQLKVPTIGIFSWCEIYQERESLLLLHAQSTCSCVMSTPTTCPFWPTNLLRTKQSKPAPEPRSSTWHPSTTSG